MFISNLRDVEYVTDLTTGRALEAADIRDVFAQDPNLTAGGSPRFWYLDDNTVNVWDANSGHEIHKEQPRLVIDTIADVVAAVRAGTTRLDP